MDAKTRKNIEYLIILLISAAMLAAGWSNRKTIAGWGNAAGNYVQINHQDGFSSIYMHLRDYCVSAGQIVSAGQLIGATGATGIATGDHLHFGISYNGVYVNPCNYVPLY